MVQTSAPTSTVSTGVGWTMSPVVPAHENLDETIAATDDDATQVFNLNGDGLPVGWIELGLAPLTDPNVDTGVELYLRGRKTGSGVPALNGYLELRQGASTVIHTTTPVVLTSSWATFLRSVPAAAVANITDWSALRLRLYSPNAGTTTYRWRVSTLELRAPDPLPVPVPASAPWTPQAPALGALVEPQAAAAAWAPQPPALGALFQPASLDGIPEPQAPAFGALLELVPTSAPWGPQAPALGALLEPLPAVASWTANGGQVGTTPLPASWPWTAPAVALIAGQLELRVPAKLRRGLVVPARYSRTLTVRAGLRRELPVPALLTRSVPVPAKLRRRLHV